MKQLFCAEIVIKAYMEGYFPMATSRQGNIFWHSPDPRAIFPIDEIKIPKSMKKKLNSGFFEFTINKQFESVIDECTKRDTTWINDEIIETYTDLHNMGFAKSIEVYQDSKLVGGLYGLAIGGAFFGESMFNTVSDASKAAFYFLIEVLKRNNFFLLDSQYINNFTQQLGAIEISREVYMMILNSALKLECDFE